MKNIIKSILFLLLLSCSNESTSEKQPDYLKEIPAAVVDTILTNRLQQFQQQVTLLNTEVKLFTDAPSVERLEKAQQTYKDVAKLYAKLYIFNIGEAKNKFFNRQINFWPVYDVAIEKTINEKAITLSGLSLLGSASKNLPALQYLLFTDKDSQKIVDKYVLESNRKIYLEVSVQALEELVSNLHDFWFGNNNYAAAYKKQTAMGLNGAFNLLYNGLYNVIDNCKITKIGKPAGLETSSHTNPKNVEAFYSNQSLDLIKSNIESVEEIFFGVNTINISAYIESITKNKQLTTRLKNQINSCKASIDAIQIPLKDAVDKQPEQVKALHQAFANLLVTMNTDVRSTLSIIITGTDNDGD